MKTWLDPVKGLQPYRVNVFRLRSDATLGLYAGVLTYLSMWNWVMGWLDDKSALQGADLSAARRTTASELRGDQGPLRVASLFRFGDLVTDDTTNCRACRGAENATAENVTGYATHACTDQGALFLPGQLCAAAGDKHDYRCAYCC